MYNCSQPLRLLLLGSPLVPLLPVGHHLETVLFLGISQVQLGEPLFKVLERGHRRVDPVVLDDVGALERRPQHLGPIADTSGVPGVAEDVGRKLLDLVDTGLGRQPLEHPRSTFGSKKSHEKLVTTKVT